MGWRLPGVDLGEGGVAYPVYGCVGEAVMSGTACLLDVDLGEGGVAVLCLGVGG